VPPPVSLFEHLSHHEPPHSTHISRLAQALRVLETKRAEGVDAGGERLVSEAEAYANGVGVKCKRDLLAEAAKAKADIKKSMDVVGQGVI